jgi:RNA polymerase sigma-70 factor (ECF subfamily)
LTSQDEELIQCYRTSGSREALEELVSRHIGKVRGLIYPMILDHAATDDLTQDVFLKAIRSLNSFEGRSAFSTWLCRIAMNTLNSHLARRSRSPVVFQDEVPEPVAGTSAAEQLAVHGETHREIETALKSLSPKLRAAIVLTCLQGKTAGEAARIEGCSAATMYWRIHEARKNLKHLLARHLTHE